MMLKVTFELPGTVEGLATELKIPEDWVPKALAGIITFGIGARMENFAKYAVTGLKIKEKEDSGEH
jgi:hypothetical protein